MASARVRYWWWPVVALLAACAGRSEGELLRGKPLAGGQQRFVGEAAGAPEGCGIHAVINHLAGFFEALNEGESPIAERFFTDGRISAFRWFSFTDRDPGGPGHVVTFTPDSLDEYFLLRHKAGDRFALRGAKFMGYETDRGTIAFSPVLFDYYIFDPVTESLMIHYGIGKGAYNCGSGLFEGMSLGAQADSDQWSRIWAGLGTRNGR